jgi:hypothetical protein
MLDIVTHLISDKMHELTELMQPYFEVIYKLINTYIILIISCKSSHTNKLFYLFLIFLLWIIIFQLFTFFPFFFHYFFKRRILSWFYWKSPSAILCVYSAPLSLQLLGSLFLYIHLFIRFSNYASCVIIYHL